MLHPEPCIDHGAVAETESRLHDKEDLPMIRGRERRATGSIDRFRSTGSPEWAKD